MQGLPRPDCRRRYKWEKWRERFFSLPSSLPLDSHSGLSFQFCALPFPDRVCWALGRGEEKKREGGRRELHIRLIHSSSSSSFSSFRLRPSTAASAPPSSPHSSEPQPGKKVVDEASHKTRRRKMHPHCAADLGPFFDHFCLFSWSVQTAPPLSE